MELLDELLKHAHRPNCQFVFPSPTGNREQHMLDHCKSIAKRAKLDPAKFDPIEHGFENRIHTAKHALQFMIEHYFAEDTFLKIGDGCVAAVYLFFDKL